ncbi:hypothetical protein NDU88_012999 [Pleurodeles waltl]|uniref:Uncharacterized protein n=1 Tax=Pleurodeles waltl TaxID=8319 RepID=A0AAV7R355_PLEWA|nr:hypothetical protein NDU88_012999 [Pleurodeles waltl]
MSGPVGPISAAWALSLLCGCRAGWPLVPLGPEGASGAPCEPKEREAGAAESADPGAPGRRLRLEGAEGRGLVRVVSPGLTDCWLDAGGAAAPLEGAVPLRRRAARVGGPVEAWSRGPGDARASLLGPSGGNPKEERERIRGLGGRLELVLGSLRGAVHQCRSPALRAAREGLTKSRGERCCKEAHGLSCDGRLVASVRV